MGEAQVAQRERSVYSPGVASFPYLYLSCGGKLKIVSVITDPVVVDRILAHRKKKRLESPFAARAPPAA